MPRRNADKKNENETKAKASAKKKPAVQKKRVNRSVSKKIPKTVIAEKAFEKSQEPPRQSQAVRQAAARPMTQAETEKRNRLITVVGITAIMILVCSLWLLNFNKIIKAGRKDLENNSSSLKTINTELLDNIENVRKGLDEIKEVQEKLKELKETPDATQASSSRDIFNGNNSASSTDGTKYKIQLPTAKAQDSLDELKQKLTEIATSTPQ